MTVHHQKYYGEGKSPSGRESPVPVAYLSVRCDFMIFVAGPPAWCEAAFELVNLALNEEGIGAKTRFRAFGRMAAADDGE